MVNLISKEWTDVHIGNRHAIIRELEPGEKISKGELGDLFLYQVNINPAAADYMQLYEVDVADYGHAVISSLPFPCIHRFPGTTHDAMTLGMKKSKVVYGTSGKTINDYYAVCKYAQYPPVVKIDFDDTIKHSGADWLDMDAKPIENALWGIKKLHKLGARLILDTCRQGEELNAAISYLERYEVMHMFEAFNDNLVMIGDQNTRKIYANFDIDDRNVGGLVPWKVAVSYIIRHWGE